MRRLPRICIIVLSALLLFGCATCRKVQKEVKDVSPYEFGLKEARTDVDRYKAILATHQAAVERGVNVDYSGIKTLDIEIPDKHSTIPLTAHTDFKGCVINVRNKVGDVVLFSRIATPTEVVLRTEQVDEGNFSSLSALKKGLVLLILEDKTPWVENREGHNYPAYRKDILMIKDGKVENLPIMPYTSRQTQLGCSYIAVRDTSLIISNVVINRTKDSNKKSFCFFVKGTYNVRMNNIEVNTPEGTGIWADGVIKFRDCAVVNCDKIRIKGTYSLKDKYGYGFDLDNVYGFKLSNSYGHGNWGVFGTNNINVLEVQNCDLNRVDIHLYGRNVRISDCIMTGGYNQFSGVYGDIVMERCRFSDFTPLINGTSYNAYVPYDLYIKDCVWDVTPEKSTLMEIGSLKNKINTREELAKKAWPNVYIDGLIVNVLSDVSSINLFKVGSDVTYPYEVGNLRDVNIKNMTVNYKKKDTESASFIICNKSIMFENPIHCALEEVHLLNGGESRIAQARAKYHYPGSVTYNLHSRAGELFSVAGSSLSYNVNSNYEYDLKYDNCILAYVRCTPSDLKEFAARRRSYQNCRIYLNNGDNNKYYLDNLASYSDCEIIPCADLEIDFTGKVDVRFDRCTSGAKKGVKYTWKLMTRQLSGGRFDGRAWTTE